MRNPNTRRFTLSTVASTAFVLALVAASGLSGCTDGGGSGTTPAASENTLLVWAGDQVHAAPDFLAVVDFDPASTRQGTRLFVPLNYGGHAGKIVMLDVARPEQPKLLDVVDLGPGSGPHFLRLTSDERRLVVSDYFLVEDLTPGGVVMVEGDHRIHVIDVRESEMALDPRFDLDFDRDIATGPARPHGMVLLTARAGQKSE